MNHYEPMTQVVLYLYICLFVLAVIVFLAALVYPKLKKAWESFSHRYYSYLLTLPEDKDKK